LHGTNILVSVGTDGWSGAGNFSGYPAISADGRFIAYTSRATNLVASPVNSSNSAIFLYDRVAGSNQMISVTAAGGPPDGDCLAPVISADGNYVTYLSQGSAIGLGVVQRNVSAGTNLFLAGGTGAGIAPSMSLDGRFIAYSNSGIRVWDALGNTNFYTSTGSVTSAALSPGGTALAYVIGTAAGPLTLVDLNTQTHVANLFAQSPLRGQWSSDGRFFTWQTMTQYSPLDHNGNAVDVYLYDFPNDVITLVSVNSAHTGTGFGRSDWPAISGDGRFVIYRSFASNIVAGTITGPNIYLFDRLSGSNSLLTASGSNPNWTSWVSRPAISTRGDLALFENWNFGLVPNDLNRVRDLFVNVVDAAVDSDGDGIPDAWMIQYFGHPTGQQNDLSRAQDDADGDGLSNLEEYIVGSNPLDPASNLKINISPVGGTPFLRLDYAVAPGRVYQVQYKDDLDDPVWLNLPGTFSVNANGAYMYVSKPGITRYYRLVATQ
jgi:hypothetical protein